MCKLLSRGATAAGFIAIVGAALAAEVAAQGNAPIPDFAANQAGWIATSNDFIAWSVKKGGPYNPSPILYGDYLYVLYDRGFFSCYDARTGKEIYSKNRVGSGTAFTSSPWAANGKIYCLSEDGDTFVIQAGPEFKILGKNSLEEMCMATPAISRGCLILRTQGQVYKIGKTSTGK